MAAHIRLIPGSGVDCTRFLPPAESERRQPLRVVLAARMLWDKGVREFVEAARTLKLQGRALRFVLAGGPDPGNPASIPESVLLDWQAAGLVDWLGHVDDMPALLASADIVVLPSYREGLPKSLIEAAACARPLVTTDAPGCRDVVTDGVNGLLVPSEMSWRWLERLRASKMTVSLRAGLVRRHARRRSSNTTSAVSLYALSTSTTNC